MLNQISGVNETVLTFNGNVEVGDLITINAGMNVAKAVADKDIMGVCVSKRGDVVGAKIKGIVTVAYNGTAPTVGYTGLATAANNEIKVAAAGMKHLVLDVNTTDKTATVLI